MKVAIPYYYELHSQLKEMYPEVEWIQVDNASAAFHKVKEGELDALVATQLNSRYMIDHYYPNELYHFLIPWRSECIAFVRFSSRRTGT